MKSAIIYFIFTVLFVIKSFNANAQLYDSVVIYAINMKASYYIKIDKYIIKNQNELPFVITDSDSIHSIESILHDSICGAKIRKLKSNNLDIRLSFEFFSKGKVKKFIGVSSYDTMFVNHNLHRCESKNLRLLEKYIPGITNMLGLNLQTKRITTFTYYRLSKKHFGN